MNAIATEREFNASSMFLGRGRPDIADVTDPSRWQWASGWTATPEPFPTWSSDIASARPVRHPSGRLASARSRWARPTVLVLSTSNFGTTSTPVFFA